MKLRKVVTLALILSLPPVLIGWWTIRDDLLWSRFNQIAPGMSPDQVVGIMGTPSWDDRCGAKMPTGLPAQCTREFGYSVTLPLLNPRYYLIWFGKDGRVVEADPITSP
jgi:hypothetical protein